MFYFILIDNFFFNNPNLGQNIRSNYHIEGEKLIKKKY